MRGWEGLPGGAGWDVLSFVCSPSTTTPSLSPARLGRHVLAATYGRLDGIEPVGAGGGGSGAGE